MTHSGRVGCIVIGGCGGLAKKWIGHGPLLRTRRNLAGSACKGALPVARYAASMRLSVDRQGGIPREARGRSKRRSW